MGGLRTAAAALCTRGTGADLEVLLAHRAPQLRFFGGYDAFPGGAVEPSDGREGEGDELELATRRAVLREAFEEAGVLPVGADELLDPGTRSALRKGLLGDDEDAVRSFQRALDRQPELLARVRPLGWLTTPPFAPVRYRTRFLHFEVSSRHLPTPCEGEIVRTTFAAPGAVLQEWTRGERLVVPPVLWQLDHLANEGLEAFLARQPGRCAAHEAGRLHRIRSAPGVWMAALRTPTLPPATTTNTFVVGEERLWILDPATPEPSEQERLFELVDALVAEGRRVEGVLVTHHHHDHVGAVQVTAERYGVPVAAHPLTLERLPAAPSRQHPLADGDRIDLGPAPDGSEGWHLEALHTPGHDRGHLAFLESRYRSLFMGDLASTVSTIVIDPPEGHLATYLDSLRRVAALDLGRGHPAHGPVAREARALLTHYLDHRARREARLLAALGPAPQGEAELVEVVYDDADARVRALARRSLRAGLDKLAEDGAAVEVAAGQWRVS